MESRITVLGATPKTAHYASKTGGPAREVKSHVCKIMLHLEGGAIDVGTMNVPEALAPEGVQPGDYMIAYRAGRGFTDDKIVGVLCKFEAVRPIKQQAPQSAPAVAPKQ